MFGEAVEARTTPRQDEVLGLVRAGYSTVCNFSNLEKKQKQIPC